MHTRRQVKPSFNEDEEKNEDGGRFYGWTSFDNDDEEKAKTSCAFLMPIRTIQLIRYENTEAVGELCHCMGEKCNSGEKPGSGFFAAILTIVLALVA